MKKKLEKSEDEMRAEYDFCGGVRGKHVSRFQKGHKTVITKSDGTLVTTESKPIVLAADLREYFPDSKSVDRALRGLINLIPDRT